MPTIARLTALEILDSRGRPTVLATCHLEAGACGRASVPSGASRGAHEALELRDGDPRRYRGLGCRQAVGHINHEIHAGLAGRCFSSQAELDRALVDLDGTPAKSRLGANSLLAVSIAFARATARQRRIPLYQHFGDILGVPPGTLPRLTINLFSGGKHAGRQIAIQDVLVVPVTASTIDASLAVAWEVYQCAAELCWERYGMRLLTADEGGLAPPAPGVEALLDLAMDAICRAGFAPGRDVALALDVASSHFYREGCYHLDGQALDSAAMLERLAGWLDRYPIVSLEDGLAEDDWDFWPALLARAGQRTRVVGDDLLCTNLERITHAIQACACDTLLLKVNQVGTLTEAAEACRLARSAGWMVTVSVRSGETEDNWAADLAVGWSGDQFKCGSVTQSERLAKYNRLLEIESETGWPMCAWASGPAPADGA